MKVSVQELDDDLILAKEDVASASAVFKFLFKYIYLKGRVRLFQLLIHSSSGHNGWGKLSCDF